jgi:hypothetical protein
MSQNQRWKQRYWDHIPVVHLDDVEIFRHRVDERRLRLLIEEKRSKTNVRP